jgi:hypothetical protein
MPRKFATLRPTEQHLLKNRYPGHVFEPDEDVTDPGRPYASLIAEITPPPPAARSDASLPEEPMLPLFEGSGAA